MKVRKDVAPSLGQQMDQLRLQSHLKKGKKSKVFLNGYVVGRGDMSFLRTAIDMKRMTEDLTVELKPKEVCVEGRWRHCPSQVQVFDDLMYLL